MKAYKLNQIKEKRILGRNVLSAGNDSKPLALFWAGSGLEVNVKAREVWVLLSCECKIFESYVTVFINGYKTMRFIPPVGKPSWICVARDLNTEKENLITIMKDTQPMPDDPMHSLFIHKLGLSDEGKFVPLCKRNLKIEFVGDSITTGEGMAGNPDEMDWIPTWMSVSENYAVQTARALDADFDIVSQCGWGFLWGWDGNIHSNIPDFYEQVCGVIPGSYQKKLGAHDLYDFTKSKKDFVVINLGTNDNGAFSQPAWKDPVTGKEYDLKFTEDGNFYPQDKEKIKQGVINFLRKVRLNNPGSVIIWALGMMRIVKMEECIKEAIADYKKKHDDKAIHFLSLDPMEETEKFEWQKGARNHPGPFVHKAAAKKITDFIREQIETQRIKNVFEKIKAGKKVTVTALGGSITTGYAANPPEEKGWAALVGKWFKELASKYNCDLTFLNEGVSGTDSAFGAVRVKNHIIDNHADLVLLEYAMNDQWLEEKTRKNSYEGVIRQILSSGETAILALFVNQRYYPYSSNEAEQRKICNYYHIPCVSWKNSVFEEDLNADFNQFFDGDEEIHPSENGHKKIAEFIIRRLEEIFKGMDNTDDATSFDKTLPPPLTQNQFQNCTYLHNKNVTPAESGEWQAKSPVHPEWEKRGGAVSGWQCSKAGSTLSVKVRGVSVGLTYAESDGFKNAWAWVTKKDGTESPKVLLECYSEFRKGYLGWAYREIINQNKEEEYTLHVQVTDEKCPVRGEDEDKNSFANITGIILGGESPVQ